MKDFKENLLIAAIGALSLSCAVVFIFGVVNGIIIIATFFGTFPVFIGFPLTVFTVIFGMAFILVVLGSFVQWVTK
jgi:hypothetical protein